MGDVYSIFTMEDLLPQTDKRSLWAAKLCGRSECVVKDSRSIHFEALVTGKSVPFFALYPPTLTVLFLPSSLQLISVPGRRDGGGWKVWYLKGMLTVSPGWTRNPNCPPPSGFSVIRLSSIAVVCVCVYACVHACMGVCVCVCVCVCVNTRLPAQLTTPYFQQLPVCMECSCLR